MTIEQISTPQVAEPPPRMWSNCLRVGDTVYVAGLTARDLALQPVDGGTYEQSCLIFQRMALLLAAAGGSLHDIVKLNAKPGGPDCVAGELHRSRLSDDTSLQRR